MNEYYAMCAYGYAGSQVGQTILPKVTFALNGGDAPQPQVMRGDVNGNNEVTIADVSALIDYLLTGDATGVNLDAADCNGVDGITIADVSALIDHLLTGSWN